MKKKLELIKRHDINGLWYIIRLTVGNSLPDTKFYRDEKEAIDAFTEAHKNLSILGDEVVLKSETYPPAKETVEHEKAKVRKVYISVDTGECYESIPENYTGGFYDIVTDAPTHFVAKAFWECSVMKDLSFQDTPITVVGNRLTELGFLASKHPFTK